MMDLRAECLRVATATAVLYRRRARKWTRGELAAEADVAEHAVRLVERGQARADVASTVATAAGAAGAALAYATWYEHACAHYDRSPTLEHARSSWLEWALTLEEPPWD